jgi:hypothetical protein
MTLIADHVGSGDIGRDGHVRARAAVIVGRVRVGQRARCGARDDKQTDDG